MGNLDFMNNMIEQKLLSLHTCFLAKVLLVNGRTAKIQPLGKTKAYGEEAKTQAVIDNVPIANSALNKFIEFKEIEYIENAYIVNHTLHVTKAKIDHPIYDPIRRGDIVICVCGERDITAARKGQNVVPPAGHHSASDAIIVGIL